MNGDIQKSFRVSRNSFACLLSISLELKVLVKCLSATLKVSGLFKCSSLRSRIRSLDIPKCKQRMSANRKTSGFLRNSTCSCKSLQAVAIQMFPKIKRFTISTCLTVFQKNPVICSDQVVSTVYFDWERFSTFERLL